MKPQPVKLIIIGAGSRGNAYADYATQYPNETQIVGVAEPREPYRKQLAEKYAIPNEFIFSNWQELAKQPRLADAVIIATPDKEHTAPALAFIKKGYHILLEKPMAPTQAECEQITQAATKANLHFAVCHVLRYTDFTKKLKKIIENKQIGDLINIQVLEPVGYWHQAHSFVRGNWRNETESSSMLLAKCCHDIDWINYIIPATCSAIQSFGNLRHFRSSEQPKGASDRCTDCSIESTCPYSALKIYFGVFDKGSIDWPLNVLTPNPTRETILNALQTGPYGRCVYACDNDVVDHQTVNMEFTDGTTATLTMTAFTQSAARKIRLFGTKGELDCDGKTIRHFDFMTDQWTTIEIPSSDPSILGGHGGGDFGLMKAFITAISQNNPNLIISGPTATMQSHRMVFSAEESRKNKTVLQLNPDESNTFLAKS